MVVRASLLSRRSQLIRVFGRLERESPRQMTANQGSTPYRIPNEWWEEAGMAGFKPASRAFRAGLPERPGHSVIAVVISDVEPVTRQLSHGVFNDSKESGSAHDRVVRILKG